MVLSLQSRAIHERNRGVILRLARESRVKMQEACQFARAIAALLNFLKFRTEKRGNKSNFLNGLRHNDGTFGHRQLFPGTEKTRNAL
ncbi:hypothetical protein ASE36_11655 [Rhizobium sp. Root274]|nr:hypothetical protein ASC71_11675 [Rhizobium sp. Root1240]KRD29314.1 hypothetical protein ASE36_11655 [Rhizobium sp. Root274]